jgi:hypothetical protein
LLFINFYFLFLRNKTPENNDNEESLSEIIEKIKSASLSNEEFCSDLEYINCDKDACKPPLMTVEEIADIIKNSNFVKSRLHFKAVETNNLVIEENEEEIDEFLVKTKRKRN